MVLALNEIKDHTLAFSKECAKVESENADAKQFWIPAAPIKKPRKPRP